MGVFLLNSFFDAWTMAHLHYLQPLSSEFGREVPRNNVFHLLELSLLPPRRVALPFSCKASVTGLLVVLRGQLVLVFAVMSGFVCR